MRFQRLLNQWYGVSKQSWRLVYRASSHGYAASDFHLYCDGISPTYVIVLGKALFIQVFLIFQHYFNNNNSNNNSTTGFANKSRRYIASRSGGLTYGYLLDIVFFLDCMLYL